LFALLKPEKKSAQYYPVVYLVKRFLLALILVFFTIPFFQVYAMVFISLASIAYTILTQPFTLDYLNFLELVNEVMILVCCYHLLPFMDGSIDARVRYTVGWSLDALLILQFLFNLFVQFVQFALKFKLTLKWRYLRYKQAAAQRQKIYALKDGESIAVP
jgi:hypothetical protein